MAHEIDMTTGRASFAYTGQAPWHGLGKELPEGTDLDAWAEAAGMNFTIKAAKALFVGEQKQTGQLKGRRILYRDDTNAGLSIVSDKFQIVQPREVLEFFETYTNGLAQMETAGVLFQGQKFFALAKINDVDPVDLGGDRTQPYLLLSSSCDGTMATRAQLTSVRVVCNNTLSIASRVKGNDVKVRHSTAFDISSVQMQMEEIRGDFKAFGDTLRALADVRVTVDQAEEFLLALSKNDTGKLASGEAKILQLFAGAGIGSALESAKETAYGLSQAVTEYYDHHAGRIQDNRISSSWFGGNGKKKSELFQEIISAFA